MKRFAIIISALLFFVAAGNSPQQEYIGKYSSIAVSEMKRTGVPASITLAQGLIESGAGLSSLAVKGNNHFGIKCHNDWKGKRMYHDDDEKGECFRVYPTPEHSFRDHSDFLRYKDRYKGLFELNPSDYKAWAKGLKAAGYATDPSYPSKLIKVIEDFQLYRFDEVNVALPATPIRIEKPKKNEQFSFSLAREVLTRNGVPFIVSAKGETYASIASWRGLFTDELLSYNDLKEECELPPGTEVFLRKKKNKAEKGLDKYVVDHDGEDLRAISQRFAVRLSSILKLNGLTKDYVPSEGDTILLR